MKRTLAVASLVLRVATLAAVVVLCGAGTCAIFGCAETTIRTPAFDYSSAKDIKIDEFTLERDAEGNITRVVIKGLDSNASNPAAIQAATIGKLVDKLPVPVAQAPTEPADTEPSISTTITRDRRKLE